MRDTDCIELHSKWVHILTTELPHLQAVRIRLQITDGYYCDSAPANLDPLLLLPKLTEIRVEREKLSNSDNRDEVAFANLTPENGLQRDHEAIHQFRRQAFS